MNPAHHPSSVTLAAYAAGTLRAGFDFVAAAHIAGCAHCRAEVRRLEAVGGAALGDARPEALAPDALARVMARLDEAPPAEPRAPTIEEKLASAKRRWVAPGVWVARVDTPHDRKDRVYMLGAAPGVATARHRHDGLEFTQVLKGALQDGETCFAAGDFCESGGNDPFHHPKAAPGEECVCLFATQGRLVPASLFGRFAFALADV